MDIGRLLIPAAYGDAGPLCPAMGNDWVASGFEPAETLERKTSAPRTGRGAQ